jgi:hypothetical protein
MVDCLAAILDAGQSSTPVNPRRTRLLVARQ